jgi:hypothetical protein
VLAPDIQFFAHFQAVGSDGEILPEHVGMPLGEPFGGATYFMLETHYDNPAMHKDLVDTSGSFLERLVL